MNKEKLFKMLKAMYIGVYVSISVFEVIFKSLKFLLLILKEDFHFYSLLPPLLSLSSTMWLPWHLLEVILHTLNCNRLLWKICYVFGTNIAHFFFIIQGLILSYLIFKILILFKWVTKKIVPFLKFLFIFFCIFFSHRTTIFTLS